MWWKGSVLWYGGVVSAGSPAVSSASEGNCWGPGSGPGNDSSFSVDARCSRGGGPCRNCALGGKVIESKVLVGLLREKGVTPARFAISCSPICQCMASTARQGIAISSATLDHISARNLQPKARVSNSMQAFGEGG